MASGKLKFREPTNLRIAIKQVPTILIFDLLMTVGQIVWGTDLWRIAVGIPVFTFVQAMFWMLRQVCTWAELSSEGVTINALTGITPGGPSSSRTKIRYDQIRAVDVTKKDRFFIVYWNDKKAASAKITVSMDESLLDSFVNALKGRMTGAGFSFDLGDASRIAGMGYFLP